MGSDTAGDGIRRRAREIRVALCLVELEPEQEIAPGFPVGVEVERAVDAAFKGVVQYEVQAVQMLDHVTVHAAMNESGKFALDALGRERALQEIEVLGVVGPHTDIRDISFIARARMRDVTHKTGRVRPQGTHATSTSSVGFT